MNTMENTQLPVNEAQNTTQPSKRRMRIVIVLFFVLLAVIIFLLPAYFYFTKKQSTPTPNKFVTRVYRDKGNFFTIQIPKDWKTSEAMAQGTTGIGTNQQSTQNIEEEQLTWENGTGIAIQIYEGTPSCPLNQPLTTTLAGFPASYDSNYNTWTVPTTKALITITISYPGSGIQHNMVQNAQTLPQSLDGERDKAVVTNVLKTLAFTELTPFRCQ
jgi:hypothetical protein